MKAYRSGESLNFVGPVSELPAKGEASDALVQGQL